MYKYPRTPHLEGSLAQKGDLAERVPFSALANSFLVIEEKYDGANSAISFDGHNLLLQSRGHYLAGGAREKHWTLFKQWANTHADKLRDVLGDRYVMYGEWMHSKHTVFYDKLLHYFLEFDVLDTISGNFLSTKKRRELLAGLPIKSVVVLRQGNFGSMEEILGIIGPSMMMTSKFADSLRAACALARVSFEKTSQETDMSGLMEGLYVKAEAEDKVIGRYKYIRSHFLQTILDSDEHWLNRPIINNRLAEGIDIWL